MIVKNKLILLLISLLFFGCSEKPKKAAYFPSEKYSLNYLVTNSDVIVFIEIFDGLPKNYGDILKKPLVKSAKARCKEIYKGNINKNSVIHILYSTVYNSPNSIETFLALRNGEYIAFLEESDDLYKPLTPYSLIEIYFNKGRPIWKQAKSRHIDIPNIPKEEIIKEIKEKHRKRKGKGSALENRK